jgi:hypothetical protein
MAGSDIFKRAEVVIMRVSAANGSLPGGAPLTNRLNNKCQTVKQFTFKSCSVLAESRSS